MREKAASELPLCATQPSKELKVFSTIEKLSRTADELADAIRELDNRLSGVVAVPKSENLITDKARGIDTPKQSLQVVNSINNVVDLLNILSQEIEQLTQRLEI